jgi:CRP-like cAMP-binding protein
LQKERSSLLTGLANVTIDWIIIGAVVPEYLKRNNKNTASKSREETMPHHPFGSSGSLKSLGLSLGRSSDDESSDLGVIDGEELDHDWLDVNEDEVNDELARQSCLIQRRPSTQVRQIKSMGPYNEEQANLVLALNEVDLLEFESMDQPMKMQLIDSLVIKTYEPGAIIMQEGTLSRLSLFFVVASAESAEVAEVELSRGGRCFTNLKRGQLFGEKFFVTQQRRPRSATAAVAVESPSVVVAELAEEHFPLWDFFHCLLLAKDVSIFNSLTGLDKIRIIGQMEVRRQYSLGSTYSVVVEEKSCQTTVQPSSPTLPSNPHPSPSSPLTPHPSAPIAQVRVYAAGSAIVNQGDSESHEFFIILEGAALVMEDREISQVTDR